MTTRKATRRELLKTTALAGGALALPSIVPSSVFGAKAPSNTVALAAFGVGQRGFGNNWHSFAGHADVRYLAACDAFTSRRDRFAAEINKKKYGGKNICTSHAHFSDALARDDIDGVVISTQDHWHVPLAYHAAVAGKDMYVEKPLGVAMAWAMKLREQVEKKKVIFQYGTQQRSGGQFLHACELVRNGTVGKITHVDAWCAGMRAPGWYVKVFNQHYKNTAPAKPPADLNYDMWVGPAPMKPYTTSRCTEWGTYHIYDNALGFIAGWGAHPLDIAQWGLDMDHTSPVTYEGTGQFPPKGLFDTIDSWDVNCQYANGVTLHFMCARAAQPIVAKMTRRPWRDHGTTFFGLDGWVSVDRAGCYMNLKGKPVNAGQIKIKPTDKRLYNSPAQSRNFIDCIKTREPTINPVESAIRSDTISHMSDICIRLGRKITWDPAKEKIVGDSEAAKMLDRPMRKPWIM